MFKTTVSADEFLRIALDPANADRRLQRIDGEIVEVVSNNKASESASNMIIFLGSFVKPRKLGRVTGSDGGYTISEEQYIPDCAFVSYQRQPSCNFFYATTKILSRIINQVMGAHFLAYFQFFRCRCSSNHICSHHLTQFYSS